MRIRWLGLALALGLFGSSAEAQVFKPKAKKTESAKAESTKAEKSAKKKTTAKKRVTTRPKKKSKAADRSEDQTTETASKETDRDYVKIWDDDE